jgi:hypothetical protein
MNCQVVARIQRLITAMVTGHGLTGSYRHRFQIIPNSTYPRGLEEEQRVNHIIFNCTQLENERRIIQNATVRTRDTWPPPLEQLMRKHMMTFTEFITSVDFNAL